MKMEAGYRARTHLSGCGIDATPRKFEAISEESLCFFFFLGDSFLLLLAYYRCPSKGNKCKMEWDESFAVHREIQWKYMRNHLEGSLLRHVEDSGSPKRATRLSFQNFEPTSRYNSGPRLKRISYSMMEKTGAPLGARALLVLWRCGFRLTCSKDDCSEIQYIHHPHRSPVWD